MIAQFSSPAKPRQLALPFADAPWPLTRPHLGELAQLEASLPPSVRECEVALKYLHLLGPLDWANFPERERAYPWPGPTPHPRAAYVAAFLVKLHEGKEYMSELRDYLAEHPALVWLLGFNLEPSDQFRWGFDVEAALPTARHFGRVLRELPNAVLQFPLDSTVALLRAALPPEVNFGQAGALDTKHILAWVAENNPKAYIKESDRLNKERQPKGDPTCKLGCKKKANTPPPSSQTQTEAAQTPPTPTKNPVRPTNFSASDVYYWGYGSGIVATKVADWGEFTLAELTQPFNRGETTYFFPLMEQTERRLGFRPPFAAFDKAFDAFYVYQYFAEAGGFAAVPFAERGGYHFDFDQAGLPLCQAGLAMPLKGSFICHTTEVEHERGRYACPLFFPTATGQACPLEHKNFAKGGCLTTMSTSAGARIRYQLDRKSDAYQDVYSQRSATERINAQAVALGIERPKLRRGSAIANQNTLIYVLLNLRGYHRVCARRAELNQGATPPAG